MFYLLSCASAGVTDVGVMKKVTDNLDFTCSILDTTDNVIEQLTRAQLEQILSSDKTIKIQGVTHANGRLDSIYFSMKVLYMQSANYTVVVENSPTTNGCLDVTLYYKGHRVPVSKFKRDNSMGYLWKIVSLSEYKDFAEIILDLNGDIFVYEIGQFYEKGRMKWNSIFSPDSENSASTFKDIDILDFRSIIHTWLKSQDNNLKSKNLVQAVASAPVGTVIKIEYVGDKHLRRRKGLMTLTRQSNYSWMFNDKFNAKDGTVGNSMFVLECLNAVIPHSERYNVYVEQE